MVVYRNHVSRRTASRLKREEVKLVVRLKAMKSAEWEDLSTLSS